MSFVVELDQTVHCCEGEEEQHGIEKDKSADGSVRVFAKNHQSDKPYGSSPEMHLFCRKIRHWDAQSSECRIENSHEGVVQFRWISLAGLEFERTVVSSQISRQTNQHLSQWRMDIEVKLPLQVMRAEFAKMSFVPCHNRRQANLPISCEKCEKGEDDWS